jgi:hypothetical protein
MRTRPYYFLACAFAVVAIIFEGAAKQYAGRAARTAAKAVQSQSPEERDTFHTAARWDAIQSGGFSGVAAVGFCLGLGAWIYCLWRGERGLQSIPLLLLILVVLLKLFMV